MNLRRLGAVVAALALVSATPAAFGLSKVTGPVTLIQDAFDAGSATLTCPQGTRVISGGFDAPTEAFAASNRPLSPRKWLVEVLGVTDPVANIHPFAYCSKKLAVTTVAATKAFDPESSLAVRVSARCPRGSVAVGGGWQFNDHSSNNSVWWSRPSGTWRAWQVRAFSGNATSITAYATCAKERTVHLRLRAHSRPIAANSEGGATVSCRINEELLSGGFGVTPKPDWDNTTGPDLFYSTSERAGKRGWTIHGWNYSNVGGNVVAFAVCTH